MPTEARQIPPDAGSPLRKMIDRWDHLWHGRYRYPASNLPTFPNGAVVIGQQQRTDPVSAAPAYTRSFSRLVAGLFMRQPPTYEGIELPGAPVDDNALAELLFETTSKAAGYGHVLLRPIFDGVSWSCAVLAPTRFAVDWVHRRVACVTVWDYVKDPRKTTDERAGLVFIERWEPGEPGQLGTVTTELWESVADPTSGVKLERRIDVQNPPADLADHRFVVSAQNDAIPRDVAVFVWAWEDCGPVPLWYANENIVEGLARLWDQEQDDAEMTRKRVAMPADLLGTGVVYADGTRDVLARPGFNKHDNLLLISSSLSAEHGANGGVTPIEFADDLIQRDRIERRENALLEAAGINPSSIGRHVGGRSDSAEAKRADNQMTMNTVTLPARTVERALSTIVSELARLNSPGRVGVGPVDVVVSEGLKENAAESAEIAQALRDAEAASTWTIVRTAHPTWSEPDVDAEVERMRAEGIASAPVE